MAASGSYYAGTKMQSKKDAKVLAAAILPQTFASTEAPPSGSQGTTRSGGPTGGPSGSFGGRRGGPGGGFVNGTITAKDGDTVTVEAADGSSKTLDLSTTTAISKTTDGTLDDIIVGQVITATGATNADGSVAAQSIQVRPATANTNGAAPGSI